MRTHDDQQHDLLHPGWDAFARYYGARAAEVCAWAVFRARVLGNDPAVAVDAALIQLDRQRHDA